MSVNIYKIECLTNLHVGSGDVNYNIVDNEVERDAVTGYPVVHASGLKGALREHFSKKDKSELGFNITDIFGQESGSGEIKAGSYKFLDAHIICRPMRVSSSSLASIPVVSIKSVNDFIKRLNVFGCEKFGTELIDDINFGEFNFLSNVKGIFIEGEKAGEIPTQAAKVLRKLETIIGEKYAVVKDFNSYDLPVVARNCLDEENGNLWYEEVVPHDSVFYTIIITPDEKMKLDLSEIIQIGGHASIGCGFTKFTELN